MLDIDRTTHASAETEQIVADLIKAFAAGPPPGDAADLEHLAALLLVCLEDPEVPAEAGFAVIDAFASLGDAHAHGMLAAVAALARPPLAGRAQAAAQRLAAGGAVSPAADQVGTLTVEAAMRVEDEEVELIAAVMARPGSPDRQVAIFGIELAETGGALVECQLSPPVSADDAHQTLHGPEGAPAPTPIPPSEVGEEVRAAAQRAAELEIELDHEAGAALTVLAAALTGEPAGLPRPPVAPGINDDDDPALVVDAAEDEPGFHRVIETLLDELEEHARAHHPPGGAMWQHGDFVASTMLDWKGSYEDGRLGHWTRHDLAEFLLEYFPRKVTMDDESLGAVPDCVLGFLKFLDARGSLSGESLELLEEALDLLRDEFEQQARESTSWGLAESMMMAMLDDGVHPEEPGAIDAWIEAFNTRPRPDREALLGPATDRMLRSAGIDPPPPTANRQRRTQRRKAQKAARKRSRRR
jgi:hypothetical protein